MHIVAYVIFIIHIESLIMFEPPLGQPSLHNRQLSTELI